MTKKSLKNKTVGHYHSDPVLIYQNNAKYDLKIGCPVYLDYTTNAYKLASANQIISANVIGVVWKFIGNNKFYLKMNSGPMKYKLPLGIDYFNKDEFGTVIENSPNNLLIPGNYGTTLWLSDSVPGGLQTTRPLFNTVIIGYKTEYGYLYRPKIIRCLETIATDTVEEPVDNGEEIPSSSSSSSS